jgi:alpha-ribazole phosphatase CobZ
MAGKTLVEILSDKGIKVDEITNSAMELFAPHGRLETKEQAKSVFKEMLMASLEDINLSSLVVAGLHLEEDGSKGLIPGMNTDDFESDSVHIIADEILGMAIAEYIGGTKARFEYVRYDTKKPGILGRLGPFADDVICGLIAGTTSQMYTEALK